MLAVLVGIGAALSQHPKGRAALGNAMPDEMRLDKVVSMTNGFPEAVAFVNKDKDIVYSGASVPVQTYTLSTKQQKILFSDPNEDTHILSTAGPKEILALGLTDGRIVVLNNHPDKILRTYPSASPRNYSVILLA